MGIFWSCSEGDVERCVHCHRKAVNNLIVINNECEICLSRRATRDRGPYVGVRLRPLFGEFRCSCGRRWNSRRSWHGYYQICRRCRKIVYPYNQRELRAGDIRPGRKRENALEDHPKNMCQMCMELGYNCGMMESG